MLVSWPVRVREPTGRGYASAVSRTRINVLIIGVMLVALVGFSAFQVAGLLRGRSLPPASAPAPRVSAHPITAPVPATNQAAPPAAADVDKRVHARNAELRKLVARSQARAKVLQDRRTAQRQARQAAAVAAATPTSLRLASFNVLGSNHTGRGGDAARFANGRQRAGWASGVINSRGLDVVGFSELQADQYAVLGRDLPGHTFFPGTSQGRAAIPTNLMWRSDRFALVQGATFPIRFVGQTRLMPYVLLRELETGREFWVLNAHNAPNGRQSERNRNVAAEVAVLRRLVATGVPVLFVGDLNEKARVFCSITGQLPMRAALGGSEGGRCGPPAGMKIDWIFGTTANVGFSGYVQDRGADVRRVTDHALVMANAQLQ